MYKDISDYGLIGDLHTVALIGLDGSIDWLCLPYIDSPSVFAALLDHKIGGYFKLSPTGESDSVAEYLPETNILVTRFRKKAGMLSLTDFMPASELNTEHPKSKESPGHNSEIYRLVEATGGAITVELFFNPALDYARLETELSSSEGAYFVRSKEQSLVLQSTLELSLDEEDPGRFTFTLMPGERAWFRLTHLATEPNSVPPPINTDSAEELLNSTEAAWKIWLDMAETGRTVNLGRFRSMINRSAIVLKSLQYSANGSIAAAATTSLPEVIGGERNWDYRYSWVRDSAFTLKALFNLGHLSETEAYLNWIEGLLGKSDHSAENLQIMYGLRGERELTEIELEHLEGHKGSRPVRIGNAAASQSQLDIYGELMDAALRLSDYVGKISADLWPMLAGICDYVVEHWHDKDSGIWEVRGGPYHFVYSKVMCWVALDRGLTIAKRYGFPADTARWQMERTRIEEEVLTRGWSEKKQAFRQHYDTDALDASNLLIPALGFLMADDPRMLSTIEATMRELSHNGFIYRYNSDDGLIGSEGTFTLCTLWMVDNLIALGKLDEAEEMLIRVENVSNHLGLFSEQYDVRWQEQLGNFPQAFTHIGYINTVTSFIAEKEKRDNILPIGSHERSMGIIPLSGPAILNDGHPKIFIDPDMIAQRLKSSMNVLRGAFFDTSTGRIAYERMSTSSAYASYLELCYSLKHMNLNMLDTPSKQLAFWINLYNVLAMHGVIALGIKDSVKEVHSFFKRVRYKIGEHQYSLDDIEHGILRANSRAPGSIFHQFSGNDPRLKYSLEQIDPRIHFALVCASSSCPPIAVYTPEGISKELDIAEHTFINSGGMVVDCKKKEASLSRVFKWYKSDFADTGSVLLLRLSNGLLMGERDKKNFVENISKFKISYQEYDWRLNRDE